MVTPLLNPPAAPPSGGTAPATAKVRSAPWKEQPRDKLARLEDEALDLACRGLLDPSRPAYLTQVTTRLAEAQALLDDAAQPAAGSSRLSRWWSGAAIEQTWRLLRGAEQGILRNVEADAVPTLARAVRDKRDSNAGVSRTALARLDGALRKAEGGQGTPDVLRDLREAALTVQQQRHDHSDAAHRAARAFRNQLLLVSLTLFALAVVLWFAQALADFRMFTVPTGGDASTAAEGSGTDPVGKNVTLLVVLFFGAVGAMFSALPSLASQPRSDTPYRVPTQQALLKSTIGMWSAVIGLLAVTTGLADGSSEATVESMGSLILLAALFGAGQEAVSRFADRRARDVLGPVGDASADTGGAEA